jgi:hypothetical protein
MQRSEWTHRVANLVFLTHRINIRASNWDFERKKKEYFTSADGWSPFPITQAVLQADMWTPEFLANRQRKMLERLASIWNLVPYPDLSDDPDNQYTESTWEFTDDKLIQAKRVTIMGALNKRDGVSLVKKTGALYANEAETLRAVCTISKRYERGASRWYWYGYSPRWREFLAGAKSAFLVLGCADRETAYAIPYEQIEKIRNDLHRTPGKHWHIVLDEDERGDDLCLVIPKGSKMSISKFSLKL